MSASTSDRVALVMLRRRVGDGLAVAQGLAMAMLVVAGFLSNYAERQ
jgi:hypothetical protein